MRASKPFPIRLFRKTRSLAPIALAVAILSWGCGKSPGLAASPSETPPEKIGAVAAPPKASGGLFGVGSLMEQVEGAGAGVASLSSGTVGSAMDMASGAAGGVANMAAQAKEAAKTAGSTALEGASAAKNLAADSAKTVAGAAQDAVKTGVSAAEGAVGTVASTGGALAKMPLSLANVATSLTGLTGIFSSIKAWAGGLVGFLVTYWLVIRPVLRWLSKGKKAVESAAGALHWPSMPGAPGMPNFAMPSMSAIPNMSMPGMPQFGMPQMPQFGMPQMPQMGMPNMPQMGMPAMGSLAGAGLGGAAVAGMASASSEGGSPAWPAASGGASLPRGGSSLRPRERRGALGSETPSDIDRAFQYRGEGMAWAGIARRLNDQGSTIHGAPWTADLVRATLTWERRRRRFERMGGELPLGEEAPASAPEIAQAPSAWPREMA